jgi:cell fate (sporulation/competence/biofilm development) regulator YlbF (YheA/YmcA/DUF963 family)
MVALTEEIKNTARQLGQALRLEESVRLYLDAVAESQTDSEASALEKKVYSVYEALIIRQQSGEQLNQQEIQAFNELRHQMLSHPIISKRNEALRLVKSYLAQVADEISQTLGIDYTTLARPQHD